MSMAKDGHFIDDPLAVENAKPDFRAMGLEPFHGCPTLTIEDELGDLPKWIERMPEDYDGDTMRVAINLPVSNAAINNEKFDLKGFVSKKLMLSLMSVKRKNKLDILKIKGDIRVSIDPLRYDDKTIIGFCIKYVKP